MTGASARIDPVTLGGRLRAVRETAGLTQSQAAAKVELSRTTLVAIESGKRRVKPEELVRLGRLYGESVGRLLRPTATIPDLTLQFRRDETGSASDPSIETTQILQRLAGHYVEIETRLGVPLVANYPPEYQSHRGQLPQQAEDLAQRTRHLLGVGPRAPLFELERTLETEIGFRIFTRPLPGKVAGAYAFHEAMGPCVALNALHPDTRRLWTLAHELGHFLTSRRRVDVLHLNEGDSERIADLFAGSLLLPAAEMRRQCAEHQRSEGRFSTRHLIYLASQFGVSIEAVTRRLEAIGLLPSGTYEKLRDRGLSERHVREVLGEPQQPRPRRLSRFSLLVAEAYDRELLSEGQVVQMLGLERLQARQMLDDVRQIGLGDELR